MSNKELYPGISICVNCVFCRVTNGVHHCHPTITRIFCIDPVLGIPETIETCMEDKNCRTRNSDGSCIYYRFSCNNSQLKAKTEDTSTLIKAAKEASERVDKWPEWKEECDPNYVSYNLVDSGEKPDGITVTSDEYTSVYTIEPNMSRMALLIQALWDTIYVNNICNISNCKVLVNKGYFNEDVESSIYSMTPAGYVLCDILGITKNGSYKTYAPYNKTNQTPK